MHATKTFWRTNLIAIIIAILVLIFIVLRLTDALQVFSFNSIANHPTITRNQIVFTSNLRHPKRFDFIAFHNNMPSGSPVWMFRVCGMPGDSVEIRNGDLWVNNQPVDKELTLSHSYIMLPKDTAGLNIDQSTVMPIEDDRVLFTYPGQKLSQTGKAYSRFIIPEEKADIYIQKVFNEPWNLDHFGPVKVPEQSYFVLGDNRSNAMDSRYIGFINQKDVKGTVLR